VSKLFRIGAVAARQGFAARGAAVARATFFVVILFVFSRLWVTLSSGRAVFPGASAFIWYVALTELVTLSAPMLFLQIEEDVRRGDLAYRLARPVSYLWTKLAEGAGEALPRLGFLVLLGFPATWLLAGGPPADARGLLLAVPLVVLSVGVHLIFQAAIGLSAFWLQEASPVYWVWQKLTFVFGGLFFPLDIYPDWLRTAAAWTPFEPLLYGCGRMAFQYDPTLAALVAAKTIAWGLVFLALLSWIYRRALAVVEVNGG